VLFAQSAIATADEVIRWGRDRFELRLSLVQIVFRLLFAFLRFRLGIHVRIEVLNRFAKTFCVAARHLRFQVVKRDTKVVGNMNGSDTLAEVLKPGARLLGRMTATTACSRALPRLTKR
jgi:hypothetical protein